MNLNLLLKASANHLMIAMLSLTFVLSACDKKTPHRNKPARKVGTGGDANQKTQPGDKPGVPGATDKDKASQNDATKTPTKPGDPIDPSNDSDSNNKTDTNSNILTRDGSVNSGNGTLIPNDNSGSPTERAHSDGTGQSQISPQTKTQAGTSNPLTPPKDQTLEDLQKILGQLHNIYLNAWYTITKDRSSRPHNFFEDIVIKMQNLGPIITLKEGESTPAAIRDRCDKYRLVQTIDKAQETRRLLLFDCETQQYANLLAFRASESQWVLVTSRQALELILPNQLGYLPTITFKPMCTITLQNDVEAARVVKADCKNWGQELSAARTRDRKTIIFTSIKYDISATNVMETQAQYLDYDGSNQVCRTGLMKRSAPNSTELIYVEDEGDGQCHANPSDQGLPIAPVAPVAPTTPANEAAHSANPRVQVVQPPPKTKTKEITDPETGEVIPIEDNGDEGSAVEAIPVEQNDDNSPKDELPPDPTADYSAVTPEAVTPPQVAPSTPTDDGSQQIDFSSSVPPAKPAVNSSQSNEAPEGEVP